MSIQKPPFTIVPVRASNSLSWFTVNGRTRFVMNNTSDDLCLGGLGERCNVLASSDTIEILRGVLPDRRQLINSLTKLLFTSTLILIYSIDSELKLLSSNKELLIIKNILKLYNDNHYIIIN